MARVHKEHNDIGLNIIQKPSTGLLTALPTEKSANILRCVCNYERFVISKL